MAEFDAWQNFSEPGGVGKNLQGADIASATTIAVTSMFHRVTGTAAIDTITPPYTGFCGSCFLVPTGAFTTTTNGNIGLASTGVVGKVLRMSYLPAQAKWYPSY